MITNTDSAERRHHSNGSDAPAASTAPSPSRWRDGDPPPWCSRAPRPCSATRCEARTAALGAVGFAIFGFVVGLTFTISGGAAIDLAYHAVMLPILVATAVQLRPRHPGGEVSPGIH